MIVEAQEEINNSSKSGFEKSTARFVLNKPTKSGQLRQYVSTNLFMFQDGSFNAKKDEYKTSLELVKRDLDRRKKKILDQDFGDNSLSNLNLSNVAQAPKFHWEKRVIEKVVKNLEKRPEEDEKNDKLPLIERLEMSYEVWEGHSSSDTQNLEISDKNLSGPLTKELVSEQVHKLLNEAKAGYSPTKYTVLNDEIIKDPTIKKLKQTLNL